MFLSYDHGQEETERVEIELAQRPIDPHRTILRRQQ